MKNTFILCLGIFFILSCKNTDSAADSDDTSAIKENRQMQTIHQFVQYLKNNDSKSALSMLNYTDSSISLMENKKVLESLIVRIDSAEKAIHLNDIDYSSIDTQKNNRFMLLDFASKQKKGEHLPYYSIAFFFDLKSDTVLRLFNFSYLQ